MSGPTRRKPASVTLQNAYGQVKTLPLLNNEGKQLMYSQPFVAKSQNALMRSRDEPFAEPILQDNKRVTLDATNPDQFNRTFNNIQKFIFNNENEYEELATVAKEINATVYKIFNYLDTNYPHYKYSKSPDDYDGYHWPYLLFLLKDIRDARKLKRGANNVNNTNTSAEASAEDVVYADIANSLFNKIMQYYGAYLDSTRRFHVSSPRTTFFQETHGERGYGGRYRGGKRRRNRTKRRRSAKRM